MGPNFFESLVFFIALAETSRATYGWTPPKQVDEVEGDKNYLRDDYYPGDISFDPLGLKPEDAEEFATMQTKELQHGRLAMLASMGFTAQELVNGVRLWPTSAPELAPGPFFPQRGALSCKLSRQMYKGPRNHGLAVYKTAIALPRRRRP